MCRLLYVNSKKDFSISEYLTKFAEISKNSKEFQGHGWGFAYWQNNKWNYYKNVIPIWEDDLTRFGNSARIIAHARSAFNDEGIVVENNMPFYDYKNIFVFNGELRGVKIRETGRIGAEKIFNYIKRFDKGNFCEAIRKGTDIIKKKSSYIRAMNIIVTDKNTTFVYSHFNEDEEYFTMCLKKEANIVVVCSDPFVGENNWQPIQNNTLTELQCL
ncbi:MAG: glutamine amidotransferases class-II [Ignavibacteria bacterium]|nr:MAG: glutamine amidotransferases class-II [Ignavibacteria bacterium]KAF0161159.1 MAG: glutamine amidotransferases class-II [Ignavibacteria bacterium]